MMEYINKTKANTDMPGLSSQSPQTSSSQILVSPYDSKDLTKATRFLAEEVKSGSLQYLKFRNLIQYTKGGHWCTPNKWEGDDGFMSHIVKKFPMPPRVPNEDDAGNYNDLCIAESADTFFDVAGKTINAAKGGKRKWTLAFDNSDSPELKVKQKFNGETVIISDDSDAIVVSDADISHSDNMSDGVRVVFDCDEEGECSTLSDSSDTDDDPLHKNYSTKSQKSGFPASQEKHMKSSSDIAGDLNSLYDDNDTKSEICVLEENETVGKSSANNSSSNVLFRLQKQILKIEKSLKNVIQSFVKKSDDEFSSVCRKLSFICLRIEKWSNRLQQEKYNQNVHLSSEIISSNGDDFDYDPCCIKSLEKKLIAVHSQFETIRSTQSEAVNKHNSTCNSDACLVRCPNLEKIMPDSYNI